MIRLAAAGLAAWQLVPLAAERGNPALAAVLFVGAAVCIGTAVAMCLAKLESRRKGN